MVFYGFLPHLMGIIHFLVGGSTDLWNGNGNNPHIAKEFTLGEKV
jgi:hypothetical protein